MNIAFAHHLSLSYNGGGEQLIIECANELDRRGHNVSIFSLPLLLDGKRKVDPRTLLSKNVKYKECFYEHINSDVTYVTYNPLSWLYFRNTGASIAGFHSNCYWKDIELNYGLLPNISNIVYRFTRFFDLKVYDAVHVLSDVFPVEHDNIYTIPNFVDCQKYFSCSDKDDVFSVGYASRKVWQKGYDIFKRLERDMTDVLFVETNNEPEYSMPEWFSKRHVTLVPSRADTFCLTIPKSILCNTPVITSGLLAHRALGLPIVQANTLTDYENSINDFYFKFLNGEIGNYRGNALKFDKQIIMDRLEDMFIEVGRK
jgi:hypothetical protein